MRRLCELLFDLSHSKILYLSARGYRKGIDQTDMAGNLERRNLPSAGITNPFGRGRDAGAEPDPGADRFAVFLIWDAKYVRFGDFGYRKQKLLDLAGINVLPAADDGVLYSPHDLKVTAGQHDREVARTHPA